MIKMKKRGQISYFLIFGAVILLSASLVLFINNTEEGISEEQGIVQQEPTQTHSLKSYIKNCIDDVTPDSVRKISKNGGAYILDDGFAWLDRNKYRYLCHNEKNKGCVNNLITRNMIEKDLSKEVKEQLKECIDLSVFEDQGYTVESGPLNVTTRISSDKVRVSLHFPVALTRFDDELREELYSSTTNVPLGKLYGLAVDITNREITEGYFDKDRWMTENGAHIIIEKHRPYPDITYNLTRHHPVNGEFSFLFALQGQDTASLLPRIYDTGSDYGCCYNAYDGLCYKNTPRETCSLYENPIYDADSSCECPLIARSYSGPECEDGFCDPCSSTYNFDTKDFSSQERDHGESWCSYDSILTTKVDHGGMSYVGSRHYKHSCIDGKEYVEEARDYREELCTQTTSSGISQASIRINRWHDCWTCRTEGCCEDSSKRDCVWSEFLFPDKEGIEYSKIMRCYPAVPPGLKFWEGSGSAVCNMATHYAVCDDFSCPNIWVDHSAVICYWQGDCGNYRNIADRLTKGGFFNSDPTDSVMDYVYLDPGLNKNPVDIGRDPLDLELDERGNRLGIRKFPSVISTLPRLLNAALEYLDYISGISIGDLINPFKDEEIKVIDYALCGPWSAPLGSDDCSLCSQPYRPCTEYRCKSLGQLCSFEMVKGEGRCTPFNTGDNKGPEVSFNQDALSRDYISEPKELFIVDKRIKGYKIMPKVKAYSLFEFGIETDEPSRCKIGFLPNVSYRYSPSIYFGESTFSKQHNISIRFPKGISIPENIYHILDVQSLSQLILVLDDLEGTYEDYKERFEDELDLYERFTGVDIVERIDPYMAIAITIINRYRDLFPYIQQLADIILSELEQNGYYFFVKCIDRAGNENSDFFINFRIDPNEGEPPRILKTIPENDSIAGSAELDMSIYVNRPSECRYSNHEEDYHDMPRSFECPERFEVSSVAHGSYECKARVPITSSDMEIFIRCREKKQEPDLYELNLAAGPSFELLEGSSSRYFNLTRPETIIADSDLLDEDHKVGYDTGSIKISMYTEEGKECRYSASQESFGSMQQSFDPYEISRHFDRGYYYHNATISLIGNPEKISIACQDPGLTENINQKSYIYHINKE